MEPQRDSFIRMMFVLSLPIILQNFLTSSLTYLDTLMIGQLNEAAIAAAGIANQVVFMFFVIQFGVHSGVSIFTAQYWGKGDAAAIRRLMGMSLLGGLVIGLVFCVVAVCMPGLVMSFFTRDQTVISLGTDYLRIVGISFPAAVLTYAYTAVLRSTEIVRLPLYASFLAVVINLVLNYALIFGHFGFPALGVKGAAMATCTAKLTEAAFVVVMVYWKQYPCAASWAELTGFRFPLVRRVVSVCWPVFLNEFFWVTGVSLYNLVYARIGTDAMAAVSIISSIEAFVMIPFFGMFGAGSVIMGNTIGAGRSGDAFRYGRYLLLFQFALSLSAGLVMILFREPVLGLYEISGDTYVNAYYLMVTAGIGLALKCANFTMIVSILRGGGDTRFGLFLDMTGVWCIGVPMAFFAAFYLGLPVYWVMALVLAEEVFKLSLGIPRFLSGKWLRNLVTDSPS